MLATTFSAIWLAASSTLAPSLPRTVIPMRATFVVWRLRSPRTAAEMLRRSFAGGMPTCSETSLTIAWLRAIAATPEGSLESVWIGVSWSESGWPR